MLCGIIPAYAGSTAAGRWPPPTRTDHPRIRGEHDLISTAYTWAMGSSPHTRGALVDGGGLLRAGLDHPRIRGEHDDGPRLSFTGRGSSPHTRGARPAAWPGPRPGGIIPAYAGSTRRGSPRRRSPADHPRIRGEHGSVDDGDVDADGSSPHTRGAPLHDAGEVAALRIIPAYAGSTSRRSCAGRSPWDHPRIRGEHGGQALGELPGGGSSPHTRGALRAAVGPVAVEGIIPAYAGSTRDCADRDSGRQDHPRIRGEHGGADGDVPVTEGSSPHTRGALWNGIRVAAGWRIIPAYAGSTMLPSLALASSQDHPRIRGEHVFLSSSGSFSPGSSPHTRGARGRAPLGRYACGIIPAYAGSTPAGRSWRRTGRDHPRIRGEHDPENPLAMIDAGSSPHTRGAP